MKQLLFLFLVICSFSSIAQKIPDLPSATGRGLGGVLPIEQGGATKKITIDSLLVGPIKYSDSLQALQATLILQNTTSINTKQPVLISGINLKTVNGIPLLGADNIVISGASSKLLSTIITSTTGVATWNFDSSSTVTLVNEGTANLNIIGSIPTGSTGILIFKQGAVNTDLLKYNGVFLNIGRTPNKISIVGFYKRDNEFIFSIDTTANVIAAAGSFDTDAQTLFTAANTNATYKTAVNNAIVALKAITLAAGGTAWSKTVMVNGRAGTTLTQQSFNWKNPTLYNYTYNGTFSYSANGSIFDSTNNYIGTNLLASDLVGPSTDIAIFQAVPVSTGDNMNYISAADGTNLMRMLYNSSLTYYSLNSNELLQANGGSTGRFMLFYSDATTLNFYKNATLLRTANVTVNATKINSQFVEGGLRGRIDVTQIINSKLTAAEAQAIDAVWAAYETALNR